MSKYGIKYEIKFTNAEKELDNPPSFPLNAQEIDIGIYDRSYVVDDAVALIVNPLISGPDPFHLMSVDNDEDKFTPVRPIQAKFQYDSTNSTGLETFTNSPPLGDDPGDPRWYVEIKISDKFIFKGFLILEDCSEAFMPKPNIVTLVASDGLGWLRKIPLVNFLDENPSGYFRIADFLTWALRKTGLQLNLNAVFNIRTAVTTTTPTSVVAQWVHIDINFGANVHYFLDLGSAGFYDVNIQPTPPPFPSTYNLTDLTFVAGGPASFALYLVATYNPGWINGIQYTGDTATITGEIPGIGGTSHLFDNVWLNAKTFEDKIGTCKSCLDAIEKILGEEGYLTQRCGEWWVLRVDEIELNVDYTVGIFLPDGTFSGFVEHSSAYGQFIAKDNYTIFFSQEDTIVLQNSQHKFVKETYKLEYPLELLCNIDMARGEFLSNLANETDENGELLTAKSYDFECWKFEREVPATTQDSESYVKRLFSGYSTYEVERFLHFPQATSDDFYYWRLLDKIPVLRFDKFTFGCSFRWGADLGGAKPYTVRIAQLRLYGNDGSFWNYGTTAPLSGGPQWVSTTSGFPVSGPSFAALGFFVDTNTTLTDWNSISFDVAPVPVSGRLDILLLNVSNPNSQTYDVTSIVFNYIAYINASYNKYDSIYDKVSRNINFRSTRDKQVYISDGLNPNFKGAMFTSESTLNFTDTTNFSGGDIIVPGDKSALFEVGYTFEVRNTGNNNRIFHVAAVFYDSGPNQTIITPVEPVVDESGQIANFYDVNFIMANRFFNWKAAPTPAPDQVHPYLHLQTFDVWNQYRNVMNVFRFTCQGLNSHLRDLYGEIYYPSLIHTYYLQDPHALTFNRRFILLTFDQDWFKCEWTGTFAEAYNVDRGKFYEGTDNEEVKYE